MLKLLVVLALLSLCSGKRLIKAPHVTPRAPLSPLAASKARSNLFPGNDTFEAGYISFPVADATFNFFYWMVNSRSNLPTDPLVFWFTGGPGCSSQLALFAENGPWTFTDPTNVSTITVNPYSWNNRATVVWVDQPVGTGFSYANKDVYERNEDEVAADMLAFTKNFYAKYPALKQKKLFISGESYGGHYVPAIANALVSANQNQSLGIPFAGLSIGNGLVDPLSQYPQYANFSYINNLISKFDFLKYNVEIKPCLGAIKAGLYDTAYGLCNAVMQGILSASGIQNVYNIHAGCAPGSGGLCYNFQAATAFLNMPAVQSVIGVPSGMQWATCNFDVNSKFSSDWMHSMAPRLLNVLQSNAQVLIYSGKLDFICNYAGGAAWTKNLQWPGSAGFNSAPRNSWSVPLNNGTVFDAGVSQAYQNFVWLEIEDAGHMVPMDQPQAALVMFNRFISGNRW